MTAEPDALIVRPPASASWPTSLSLHGHGERTVLMLHGWPDSRRLWDATVQALQGDHRCACLELPGFGDSQAQGPASLEQVIDLIDQAVDTASPNRPVTLLLHDWGCFYGYQYAMRHRDRVERVIGVDIGDAGSRYHRQELGLRAKLGIVTYQWWLALAWLVGGGLGNRMARWMARRLRAPAAADVTAAMGYPYAVQWLGVAGGFGRPRSFAPTMPMLFIYGERKPFSFHSQSWADRVRARPGCRVVGLPTGHWVMVQKPHEFNATVRKWLDETAARSP
jgi:pimeloyl-ACP methyl ester carboxylesterase